MNDVLSRNPPPLPLPNNYFVLKCESFLIKLIIYSNVHHAVYIKSKYLKYQDLHLILSLS